MTVSAPALRGFRHPQDASALADVFNAMATADGLNERRSAEQLAAWYARTTPHFEPARDILLAELDGRAVAYGRHEWVDTSDGLREHRIMVFAGPAGRAAVDALIDALDERAAAVAAAQGPIDRPRVLATFSGDGQAWRVETFERRGYEVVRWAFEMVRPNLDDIEVPPLPEGLELRPIEGRDALRQVWDADVEAFRDHWGGFDASDEAFEEWLTEPDLDPSLFVVAFDGDEIAGGVLNQIAASENEQLGIRRGWLDSVFTRRPWRRRGLAAALVARSLLVLRDRGMDSAILGVDAENPTGALGVYERAGFEVATREPALRRAWPF
ncbi:MAG TPA: GNAT family N-acetyltransferase [Candidatus Limnocylindria bacterium]|nr:GNAT family N-acetyltransferase [Candidatus Limnocylindria bacterium]